jgi:hypothetical protein
LRSHRTRSQHIPEAKRREVLGWHSGRTMQFLRALDFTFNKT